MGLNEFSPYASFVPEDPRTKDIQAELKAEFYNLLRNGGAITARGTIFPIQIDEIQTDLPPQLQEALETMPAQKVRLKEVQEIIGEMIDIEELSSRRTVILIGQNAINRLAYWENTCGSIAPVIIGFDGSKTPRWQSGQFPSYFAERARTAIRHEQYPGSQFRFTASLLKEFAETEGLGNIYGEKAQQAIKDGQALRTSSRNV